MKRQVYYKRTGLTNVTTPSCPNSPKSQLSPTDRELNPSSVIVIQAIGTAPKHKYQKPQKIKMKPQKAELPKAAQIMSRKSTEKFD